jgi:predicted ATP-dependent endonuclease of OLD family
VRIWNERHRVSVPFDERSKGFVWFFSFLSYFSKLEVEEDADLILLLDEPALNLHAMAQADFLHFIDERLAPKHQVIYSTHSPFMINLDHLNRVRTVQDVDDRGTVISDDVLTNDQETLFPVQVALSYRMAQSLFLAPHCLMVNAPSDLIYLQVLGEVAAARNRTRLDPRWVIIPVGGVDNLHTLVSLLGENYVSVAVLMDVTPASKERIEHLSHDVVARPSSPIKWVEVTRVRDSDIEDLLDADFYLKLVNAAYDADLPVELTLRSISDSNPRIVHRIAAYFESEGIAGGRFDPYLPAAYLLQHHAEFRNEIDDSSVERVASLFERINSLLPTNGAVPSAAEVARGHMMTVSP